MNKIFYKDYQNLFKQGDKLYSPSYIIYYIDFHKQIIKTAVKRKLGKAVARNYEKRVIRKILSEFRFKKNYFLLVICQQTLNKDFKGKRQYLRQLLQPLMTC